MVSQGKKQLIEILEIADINFLMSIKHLDEEDVRKVIQPGTNSIQQIFGHCVKQMDKYLAKDTKQRLFDADDTFGNYVEVYLKISNGFFDLVRRTPEEDYIKPIDKGEKLGTIIQRISLHFMGHLGQIYLIRRALRKDLPGSYSFVLALSESSRRKLRIEWLKWWEENKINYI